MNRVSQDYTPDNTTPVDEVTHGFLRLGTACLAWVAVGAHQYVIRFDSRRDVTQVWRETSRMVGVGGFTYYLGAVLCNAIREGMRRK